MSLEVEEFWKMKILTEKDGKKLLEIARGAISAYLKEEKFEGVEIGLKAGVFVTLHKGKELRGCIGFIEGVEDVGELVVKAARGAAFGDPRFLPLREDELGKVKIEISVLSEPKEELCSKKELPGKIDVGKDGLVCKCGMAGGLLLPQVAVEYGWGPEEFLENVCEKAGLEKEMWKIPQCKIFRFQCQVFKE